MTALVGDQSPVEQLATTALGETCALQRQPHVAGALRAGLHAARRVGAACHLALLLHDAETGLWRCVALLDPIGRAQALAPLGLPASAFAFAPPATSAPSCLGAILGEAWGASVCTTLEARLGVAAALCVTIEGVAGPLGALVALVADETRSALLERLLAHTAIAAAPHLRAQEAAQAAAVLGGSMFLTRAATELSRAARYRRPLTVALFDLQSAAELPLCGEMIIRTLRETDIVGRLPGPYPRLCALLPETNRAAAGGLLRRLGERAAMFGIGTASFPEDAREWSRLVELATTRARARVSTDATQAVVACPLCLRRFTLDLPSGANAEAARRAQAAAAALLEDGCPRHREAADTAQGQAPPVTARRRRFRPVHMALLAGGACLAIVALIGAALPGGRAETRPAAAPLVAIATVTPTLAHPSPPSPVPTQAEAPSPATPSATVVALIAQAPPLDPPAALSTQARAVDLVVAAVDRADRVPLPETTPDTAAAQATWAPASEIAAPTPPPAASVAAPLGSGCPVEFPVKVTARGNAYPTTSRQYAAALPVVCYPSLTAASVAGYRLAR